MSVAVRVYEVQGEGQWLSECDWYRVKGSRIANVIGSG